MRFVLFCEHVDWEEFADEAPAYASQDYSFDDFAAAEDCWSDLCHNWINGKSGWFVDTLNVYDDAGERFCLGVEDDFPYGDFAALVEACLQDEDDEDDDEDD